jgi:TonB family protein
MRFILAKTRRLVCVGCIFFALASLAQQSPDANNPAPQPTANQAEHGRSKGEVELLSKFKGPDVPLYMVHLFRKVQSQPSFAMAKAPPINLHGESMVEFSILKDGDLEYAKLVQSCGDPAVDQSLLTAIQAAAPFRPLAADFKGKHLKLRWHLMLNPKATAHSAH